MGDSHLNAILATIRSGEFSDLSFVGEEKTFFVHKAIVCPQSEVLKEAVQAVPTVDFSPKKIDMTDFHVSTIESFVQFLYTGDYVSVKEETSSDSGGNSVHFELVGHVHCHYIASLYKVPKMVDLAKSNLDAFLEKQKGTSGLVSALPTVVQIAQALSVDQVMLETLAASAAHNLVKLEESGLLPDISKEPEFLLSILKHSALHIEQLENGHTSALKAAKDNHANKAKAMGEALEAARDKHAKDAKAIKEAAAIFRQRQNCQGSLCSSHLLEITDDFKVICSQCRFTQALQLQPAPKVFNFGTQSWGSQ